jgi:hypothetical protein
MEFKPAKRRIQQKVTGLNISEGNHTPSDPFLESHSYRKTKAGLAASRNEKREREKKG